MSVFDLAEVDNISPWDALQTSVNRRAQRVRWVDAIIERILAEHEAKCDVNSPLHDPDYALEHTPAIPPASVKPWLMESRNEERLLTRAAKLAIDAGVADAVVRRWQAEAKRSIDALIAGLDAIPTLSTEDRIKAIEAMQSTLMPTDELPSGRDQPRVIDVLPGPDVEDERDDT